MPIQRREIAPDKIQQQRAVCERVRSRLGDGERYAMVDTYGCQQNESDSEVLRGYLRDITGNRRFWIIKLHQKRQRKKWNFDEAFRAQFWAEAKAIWKSGEKLYLEGDLLDEAEEAQRGAMEVDERVGMIEEYLNTALPDDWDELDLYARRNYLSGNEFGTPEHKGTVTRTEVSNAEIWCECFGKSLQELKPSDSYGIAAMMAQVEGWERTSQVKRQRLYGRQRIYQKSK